MEMKIGFDGHGALELAENLYLEELFLAISITINNKDAFAAALPTSSIIYRNILEIASKIFLKILQHINYLLSICGLLVKTQPVRKLN
ncbi:hypothetical protein KC726_00330 [Candidatus Woesebacteria bacterium]|nr:hypothetical protein [Candidatus Woesebacteria bacterium]